MRKYFTVFLLVTLSSIVFAQDDAGIRADSIAMKLLTGAKLPGLSIAVSRGDSLVWSKGFGYSDVQQKKPITSATRFRIGSVTKLFTAAVAARLAQQGSLDLDAQVSRYVPSFPDKGAVITTRQLLGHLSGIRHYGRNEYLNERHYRSIAEALTIFDHDSLLSRPGTKYSYSSYGYVLASAVIEKASGRGFLGCLKDSLFDVLSLRSTSPDVNDTLDGSQATPYSLDSSNTWVRGPFNDNSNRWAAGGFLSTAEDLVRFGSTLQRDGYLNEGMRKTVFTSQRTTDGKETGVGLGWRIAVDSLQNVYYHHGGESIGGRAFLLIYPGSDVVVALLANLTFAKVGAKEALEIARLFSP